MVGLINDWQVVIDGQRHRILPDWLQQQKAKAWVALENHQSPNRKMESWRYTDASLLLSERLATREQNGISGTQTTDADCCIVLTNEGVEVVGNQPDWLNITDIQSMSPSQYQPIDVRSLPQEQGLVALNQALVTCGCAIEVSSESQGTDLMIDLIYDFSDNNWQFVQNHIKVAKHGQLKLREIVVGGRINSCQSWLVGQQADVVKIACSKLVADAMLVMYNQYQLQERAQMRCMHQRSGGMLQHHNQQVIFIAEYANYLSGSINKSLENSQINDIINVFHDVKNNESKVIHRSIADDHARVFNNAKAIIAQGADGSLVAQDLKNILLSDDAKIFSKPELEVYTDEVVAAHGSTIGSLDEQSLFYLQSRGIPMKEAREIMIESFIAEAEVC